MSYVFHPAAMQELDQAVDYYNEHGGKDGNKNADNPTNRQISALREMNKLDSR